MQHDRVQAAVERRLEVARIFPQVDGVTAFGLDALVGMRDIPRDETCQSKGAVPRFGRGVVYRVQPEIFTRQASARRVLYVFETEGCLVGPVWLGLAQEFDICIVLYS